MIENKQGKPRRFKSEKEFLDTLNNYINLCVHEWKQLPNISGFCVYCDIHRDTFYQQKEYYPDTYKKAQDIIENAVLNCKHASDTIKIFYLKCKFKYHDNLKADLEPIHINVVWE